MADDELPSSYYKHQDRARDKAYDARDVAVHEEFAMYALELLQPALAAMGQKWKGSPQLRRSWIDFSDATYMVHFKLVARRGLLPWRRKLADVYVHRDRDRNGKDIVGRIKAKPRWLHRKEWEEFSYKATNWVDGRGPGTGDVQKPEATIAQELVGEFDKAKAMQRLSLRKVRGQPAAP